VNAGIAHSTIKLGDITTTNEHIEPKSYTIDISFENLGLALKSVSITNSLGHGSYFFNQLTKIYNQHALNSCFYTCL
jgi:hypothetical protein